MPSFHPLLQAAASPQTGETPQDDAQASLLAPTGSESATPLHDELSTTGTTVETVEAEEIQLQGNLGRDPWFTTDGNELIGRFPLAVHDKRGKPTWHRVVVFGETATALQEAHRSRQIRKGRSVQVVGQHIAEPEETADGRTRINREFHATNVTRLIESKERPEQR